jgi:hypothetical protein
MLCSFLGAGAMLLLDKSTWNQRLDKVEVLGEHVPLFHQILIGWIGIRRDRCWDLSLMHQYSVVFSLMLAGDKICRI